MQVDLVPSRLRTAPCGTKALARLKAFEKLSVDATPAAIMRGQKGDLMLLGHNGGTIREVEDDELLARSMLILRDTGHTTKARCVMDVDAKTVVPVVDVVCTQADFSALFVFFPHASGRLGCIGHAGMGSRRAVNDYIAQSGARWPYRTCGACERVTDGRHKCGGCRARYYCNATCQRFDWAAHRSCCLDTN